MPTDRYTYPAQEVDGRYDDAHVTKERKLGKVVARNAAECWVEIKKTAKTVDEHPYLRVPPRLDQSPGEGRLHRAACRVGGRARDGRARPHRAARDLLLGEPARGCSREAGQLRRNGEDLLTAARRLGRELDGGVLPIQGPPGAGKTYAGARMIVELVRQGKRVGITALSHKVIRKLLDEAVKAAAEEQVSLRCVVKVSEAEPATGRLRHQGDGRQRRRALGARRRRGSGRRGHRLAMVSRGDGRGGRRAVHRRGWTDGAGGCARRLSRGSQPGAAWAIPSSSSSRSRPRTPKAPTSRRSAHLLGGHRRCRRTAACSSSSRGDCHPAVCAFTSEQFYESRLTSRPGLERQTLHGPRPLTIAVSSSCPSTTKAAERVDRGSGADRSARRGLAVDAQPNGPTGRVSARPLELQDVLVVAPYNAQLAELARRLPPVRAIGTVDKFQGQEAPVVIYSMTTSSPDEAPRGMEFLYSRNRLNVATSRAQCACVVVASPRLLSPDCRTPASDAAGQCALSIRRAGNGRARARDLRRARLKPRVRDARTALRVPDRRG